MHFRPCMIPVAAVCLLLAGGCTRADRPPLGTVTGTVTLDGRPLADAMVAFTPEGPGRTSLGTTDATGRYRLAYLRDIAGARPGRHVVRITTGSVDDGRPEILPATYHRRSNLEAQVEPGDNTIDFALKAK